MTSTALVWGANGGIGRSVVQTLYENNWTVGAVARHWDESTPSTEHRFEADIANPFSVQQAVYAVAQVMPAVDLWVYAVGDITSSTVGAMEPVDWQRILDANLNGAYLTTHFSEPLLAEEAHAMYLGAVSERLALPGLAAYAAAKAGLESFVTALSKENRRRRYTVIRPGAVDTPLWSKMPVRLPRNAMSPEETARRILSVYQEGQTGIVDL